MIATYPVWYHWVGIHFEYYDKDPLPSPVDMHDASHFVTFQISFV